MSRFRTPLKGVRGLGSAKTGTAHFVNQRLTATALVLLGIWFLVFVVNLIGATTWPPPRRCRVRGTRCCWWAS